MKLPDSTLDVAELREAEEDRLDAFDRLDREKEYAGREIELAEFVPERIRRRYRELAR